MKLDDLSLKIESYDTLVAGDEHHRYRSWEHCYRFFRDAGAQGLDAKRDQAALQLGFYLASWGMYRGSSFLLQRAYTVHLPVVDVLAHRRFAVLWTQEITGTSADAELVSPALDLVSSVREAYSPFGNATDTLVTKVILGTVGCLPACDRFFCDGLSLAGLPYSAVNRRFVDRIVKLCVDNRPELETCRSRIFTARGLRYPLMKLLDMYFWQLGYEASPEYRASMASGR